MRRPWYPVPLWALPAARGPQPTPETVIVEANPAAVADRERPASKHAPLVFAMTASAVPVQANFERASLVQGKRPAPHRQQSNDEASRPYCFTLSWLTPHAPRTC